MRLDDGLDFFQDSVELRGSVAIDGFACLLCGFRLRRSFIDVAGGQFLRSTASTSRSSWVLRGHGILIHIGKV